MLHNTVISSFENDFSFLSNFYRVDIFYKNIVFKSTEHAYQWSKFDDYFIRLMIQTAESPAKSKRIAQVHYYLIIKDWDNNFKLKIMEELLKIKFKNTNLAEKLIQTKDYYLVEGNNWGDTFWGVCNNQGLNHLGLLLMKIRKELIEEQNTL